MGMFASVKNRFAVLHVGLVTSACLLLGTVSYGVMTSALQRLQQSKLDYIAESQALQLENRLQNREARLRQLAQGDIVLSYSRSYDEKLLQEYFNQFSSTFSTISYVNRLGREELKLVDGRNSTDLKDLAESKIFSEVSWIPNRVFTRLDFNTESAQWPRLVSGFHRQNFFGEFEGIVVVRNDVADIMQPLREFVLGQSGFISVLDKSGRVLTHRNDEVLYKAISAQDQASERLLTRARAMQRGFARVTLLGIDGFVAYAPVGDRGWSLLVTLPYSEFMAEPTRYRNLFIQLMLMLVVGGILLSMYMASAISNPIRRLIQSSRRIAHGDLNQRVDIENLDEIGQLGASFNMMAANLQHSRHKLDSEARIREELIRELETKNAELERFSYTVSHDLKSPLVTVKGFIGLLKEDLAAHDEGGIEQDLQQIEQAADRMVQLLDDLLELSRIGHQVNEFHSVNLNDLFDEAIELVRGRIEQTDAQITIQRDMPSVMGDRQRLLEVAQNLLDNAIKFRQPDQAPSISVSANIQNDRVVCHVTDQGIGIDERYQQRIFNLFERLDPSHEDGTGIGLALVKRIIEVHNGDVSVSSKGVGKGTEFRFSLPVVHPEH